MNHRDPLSASSLRRTTLLDSDVLKTLARSVPTPVPQGPLACLAGSHLLDGYLDQCLWLALGAFGHVVVSALIMFFASYCSIYVVTIVVAFLVPRA